MTEELLGLGRTEQYALIGLVGLVAVVVGVFALSTYATLAAGVGLVMVGYAAIGAVGERGAAALDLGDRTRIGILVAVGLLLIVANTVIGDVLGASVGILAFFVGLLCLIYGGGLAIGHATE